MTARIYALRKITRQQAHDYVSARHRLYCRQCFKFIKDDDDALICINCGGRNQRVDDFDPKTWRKSVAVFWACVFAFGLLMAGLKYMEGI